MEIIDVKFHNDIPFDEYLKLEGNSNSFLKAERNGICEEFVGSAKVEFGSLVDDLLTDPAAADLDNPEYFVGVQVATAITEFIGGHALASFKSQVSFTGTLFWKGLEMKTKGRLDLFGMGIVFDLKITEVGEKQLDTLIEFMGYKNQMFLYAKAVKATMAVLVFYSRKDKKVILKPLMIGETNTFFEEKILKFGK